MPFSLADTLEWLKDLPHTADPWVKFGMAIAGLFVAFAVPISNMIVEHRKLAANDKSRAEEVKTAGTQLPLSPYTALLVDGSHVEAMKDAIRMHREAMNDHREAVGRDMEAVTDAVDALRRVIHRFLDEVADRRDPERKSPG